MTNVNQSFPTPHLAKRAEDRIGIRTRKAFPKELRAELLRFWPSLGKAGPRLRKHGDYKGALILETAPRLQHIDPPNIKIEGITRSKLKKLQLAVELDGFRSR